MKSILFRFSTSTLSHFKTSRAMIPLTKLDRLEQNQITLKPFYYISEVPSKLHKIDIVQAFNHWLKAPEDKVNQIGDILRTVHTVTLIVDDIQDNSKLRYGRPVAHHVFGIGLTVNAVCQALGIAFEKVAALGHPEAIKIYLNAVDDCSRGQGIELYWRDNFLCPTEEEYFDMVKQKASSMFLVILQLLQLFSESVEDYQDIAILIGVYYAIRDEYCNLFNRESLKDLADNSQEQQIDGQDVDSDVTDGKFTLFLVHALQKTDHAEEIMNILKQRTTDQKIINHCTSLLQKIGSTKYVEDVLEKLEMDIENEIHRLGGNPKLTLMMEKLRKWKSPEK